MDPCTRKHIIYTYRSFRFATPWMNPALIALLVIIGIYKKSPNSHGFEHKLEIIVFLKNLQLRCDDIDYKWFRTNSTY